MKFHKSDKKAKKEAETEKIVDAYDESERTLHVEDAHRDVVYSLPPVTKQLAAVYMTQMKKFTKQKVMWLLLVLLILMPIAFFAIHSINKDLFGSTGVMNTYMSTILMALPVMSMLIASIVCGSMLPQEFNERTVYLSLPLPLNRSIFYYGKFLAGLTLAIGVISAAFGIAAILATMYTSTYYSNELLKSYLIGIVAVFNYCAFAYMLSSKSMRGSSMAPLVLLFVVLPLIALVLVYAFGKIGMDGIADVFGYLPIFGSDLAINSMGYPASGMYISLIGILNIEAILPNFSVGSSSAVMVGVSLVLGIICLLIGQRIIERRDM